MWYFGCACSEACASLRRYNLNDDRPHEGTLDASSEAHARQQGLVKKKHSWRGRKRPRGLDAPSEAHARQQGLLGVGEDAREVEGPLWVSSEAHAR
jgi:hypothetical protein